MNAIGLEIRKLKRKHYWLMAAGAAGLPLLWLAGATALRSRRPVGSRLSVLSLNEVLNLGALLLPIIAAILASRLVTVDTEARMGQMFTALGQRPDNRFFAKLAVGSVSVAGGQLLMVLFTALASRAFGLQVTAGYRSGVLPALIVLTAASIAAMATQLMLATCAAKQAVGLGVAVVAAIACSALPFAQLAAIGWVLPWGITGAASPIDTLASQHSAGDAVLAANPLTNALVAVLVAALWVAVSRFVIVWKENHQ